MGNIIKVDNKYEIVKEELLKLVANDVFHIIMDYYLNLDGNIIFSKILNESTSCDYICVFDNKIYITSKSNKNINIINIYSINGDFIHQISDLRFYGDLISISVNKKYIFVMELFLNVVIVYSNITYQFIKCFYSYPTEEKISTIHKICSND